MVEGRIVTLDELSNKERFFKSQGHIEHQDADFLYLLRSEGGLKQFIEIIDKKTMQKVKEIDLKEQNLSSMDSNAEYFAFVYRKGAAEIWEKHTWNLKHEFKYENSVGFSAFMTEDMLLVALYSSQCAIYFYDKNTKVWNLKGYPPLLGTPFISAFSYDGLVYLGGMYEEILVAEFATDRFHKHEIINTWGRYVTCIRVDDDYIYHRCEMGLGISDRTKKEVSMDDFEDYYDGAFDLSSNYLIYSKEKGIVIQKKKSWDINCIIDTSDIQSTDVFVDGNDIYFNSSEGDYYRVAIND